MSTPTMPGGPQGLPQGPQYQPYQGPQYQPYQGPQYQPYQGPQYQGHPGQPSPVGQPPAPMSKPPRKRGLLAGIGGVLTVVLVIAVKIIIGLVIGLGGRTAVQSADDAHQTAIGECATVTGTAAKPKYAKADCGSGKENYIVGVVLKSPKDNCPASEAYDEYHEAGTLNNVKLCLAPVFADGKCYKLVEGTKEMGYPEIACSAPNAAKVKVIKGQADKSLCGPNGAGGLAYPPLKLTYCVGPPTGASA